MVLKEDNTEIDNDEVLQTLTQVLSNSSQIPLLKISRLERMPQNLTIEDEEQKFNPILENGILNIFKVIKNLVSYSIFILVSNNHQIIEKSTSSSNSPVINSMHGAYSLKNVVYSKLSDEMMKKLQSKKSLSPNEKSNISVVIADFLHFRKDVGASAVQKITSEMCRAHPESFSIVVGGKKWSDGQDNFKIQIRNRINYLKSKQNLSLGNGTAAGTSKRTKKRSSTLQKQDEYGCVEYSPPLPDDETPDDQEAKRNRLLKLHQVISYQEDREEINRLMDQTYPTQRAQINGEGRDLVVIMALWPFLRSPTSLILHASRLLGKDVRNIWNEAIQNKTTPIAAYMKSRRNVRGREQIFKEIFQESEEANVKNKSRAADTMVIFPLLINYFKEKSNYFYTIVDVSIHRFFCLVFS